MNRSKFGISFDEESHTFFWRLYQSCRGMGMGITFISVGTPIWEYKWELNSIPEEIENIFRNE